MTLPEETAAAAPAHELGERKTAVLRAVVEEYVRTGEPVGSEAVAENAQLGVSPATIRNEMAALEELGYLSHPHTSAGRVPTDLGYRYFVNALPSSMRLRDPQRRAIAEFFGQTMMDLEETLVGATQLLSRMTQYAGLALPPSVADERVIHVELVGVGPNVLALIVGQHGRVDKRVFERAVGLGERELGELSDRLGRALAGHTLTDAEIEARKMATSTADAPERDIVEHLAVALGEMREGVTGDHVLVRGVANLAGEAAAWRRETVQRLFEALEREQEMLTLMRGIGLEGEVSVTIGAEHPSTGEWDAAIVTAPYRVGDQPVGTIGVVGPTRMDYLTAIATVRAVARRISELASSLE